MAANFQMTFPNIFFIKIVVFFIKISLKFAPEDPIDYTLPQVLVMAWHWIGDQPRLPAPVETQNHDAIWYHQATMSKSTSSFLSERFLSTDFGSQSWSLQIWNSLKTAFFLPHWVAVPSSLCLHQSSSGPGFPEVSVIQRINTVPLSIVYIWINEIICTIKSLI